MRKVSQTLFFSMTALLASGAAQAQVPPAVTGGVVLEQSSEYRFQLDLQVNPAALAKWLPPGWDSNAATAGAAKDANLRLIFIDCVDVSGPDNKILGRGSNRLAYLAAPVKQSGGAATGQMILGGISEEAGTPDGFGTYLKAAGVSMARSANTVNGGVQVSEDWDFTAAGGEHLHLHVKYLRGSANKAAGETKFYNPGNPTQYQVFKTEQATDITRNVTTTPPDRVMEFSFSAGGGKFVSLFDGSEKVLSWDSQPVYARTVISP